MRGLRILVCVLLIFLCGNFLRQLEDFRPESSGSVFPVCGDSLTAYIGIRSGMYTSGGFRIGFQHELLTAFADSLGAGMNVTGVYERGDCWKMLADGDVDIVAVNASDSVPAPYLAEVMFSMPFRGYVWAVRGDRTDLLAAVNRWLGLISASGRMHEAEDRYFRSYNVRPRSGAAADRISPYDGIIRKYSSLLGWDWRLLAAVVFKESRFSVGAYSRRGAAGLMQVKLSTAEYYGVTDLLDPEENIRAGVLHLRRIQERYQEQGLDSVNVVKFTLAAYNAGESRIRDCVNFTMDLGRDFMDWDTVAATIPLMAEREYVEDADFLRHGRFRGQETVRYVRDVLSKYEEYRTAVEG